MKKTILLTTLLLITTTSSFAINNFTEPVPGKISPTLIKAYYTYEIKLIKEREEAYAPDIYTVYSYDLYINVWRDPSKTWVWQSVNLTNGRESFDPAPLTSGQLNSGTYCMENNTDPERFCGTYQDSFHPGQWEKSLVESMPIYSPYGSTPEQAMAEAELKLTQYFGWTYHGAYGWRSAGAQDMADKHFYVWATYRTGTPGVVVPVRSEIVVGTGPAQSAGVPLSLRQQMIPEEAMTMTKDPINIATGEMFINAADFDIKAVGFNLRLSRTYRSQSTNVGLFGNKWRTPFDGNLTVDAAGNITIFDGGGVVTYFIKQVDNTYKPYRDGESTLVKNAADYTVTDKNGMKITYDLTGRLIQITDRNNFSLKFVKSGATAYIQDATGRKISLTLDASGRITTAKDPLNRTFSYIYDGFGNLTKATNPLGLSEQYTYDSQGHITQTTNFNGHNAYFLYDAQGRAYQNWQDGGVNKSTLTFGTNTTTTVDSLGNQHIYKFNNVDLETSHTDPLGNVITKAYDAKNNLISTTDAKGSITKFFYDGKSNLIKTVDAIGATALFTYTPDFNLLASTTDPLGRVTQLTHDTKGNLLQKTDPMGKLIKYNYTFGVLSTITDTLGNVTRFSYDGNKCVTQISKPLFNSTKFTYDLVGNTLTSTDGENNKTTYKYDVLNRIIQTTFANSANTYQEYDGYDNPTKFTDQRGGIFRKEYDVYERLIKTINPIGGTTINGYDSEGNLLSITDQKGFKLTFIYDALGRTTKETNQLGYAKTRSYDKNGNLQDITNENGQRTSYTYDALNHLINTFYPDGKNITNNYNAVGDKLSVTDYRGTTAYTYDTLSRVLSEDGPQSADTISYTYDSEGNRLTVTDQNSQVYTYAYDTLNRILNVTDAKGKTAYTYDNNGNIQKVTYPSKATLNYTYTNRGKVASIINKAANLSTMSSLTYTYDPADMVTKKVSSDGSSMEYVYDAMNQLVKETKKVGVTINYENTYTYDPNGNRLTSKDKAYEYDNANRLLSISGSTVILYGYDNNGNRTSKIKSGSTTIYAYDYENRLISTNADTFEYDHIGRRIKSNLGGVQKSYLYNGMDVVLERGAVNKSYTLGNGLISQTIATVPNYFHYDAVGSVTSLSDTLGVGGNKYDYDAFGISSSPADNNTYRFSGNELDNGLIHFDYRYYDPEAGRWLTPDPSGLSDGLNQYLYANNNPVNFVDPNGLWIVQAVGAVVGGVVNATVNFSDYKSGNITGKEYATLIGTGAIVGALVTVAPNLATGALLAGGGSAVNDFASQAVHNKCRSINLPQTGKSFVQGAALGMISGSAGLLGSRFLRISEEVIYVNRIKYLIPGQATNYGRAGGLIGDTTGTITTNQPHTAEARE